VRDTVLFVFLRRRHLVVAAELQFAIDDIEQRVGTPVQEIGGAAAGPAAATPFVGEDDLRAVVVESRRMPVREILVGHVIESHRVLRIADVEQDAVARAGACRKADLRIDRDVVTLIRDAGLLCAWPMIAAGPQARDGAGGDVRKDARTADDFCVLRRGQGYLNYVDAEQRRIRIFLGIEP
jgi:hypothetical protein